MVMFEQRVEAIPEAGMVGRTLARNGCHYLCPMSPLAVRAPDVDSGIKGPPIIARDARGGLWRLNASGPGHGLFDRRQRGVGLGAVGAAGLRHVGPTAAALAAQDFRALADEL